MGDWEGERLELQIRPTGKSLCQNNAEFTGWGEIPEPFDPIADPAERVGVVDFDQNPMPSHKSFAMV